MALFLLFTAEYSVWSSGGFCFFMHQVNLPSVGVSWRRSNPPWFQNPNRPDMKGKLNYAALFQINWTPPSINVEILTQETQTSSLFLRNWKVAKIIKKTVDMSYWQTECSVSESVCCFITALHGGGWLDGYYMCWTCQGHTDNALTHTEIKRDSKTKTQICVCCSVSL